mmetsp:Transcript_31827/g.72651  ORF Transcript_31827/g.72651 Transcript_31827/m.72651 type:complete len:662 (+) Transcript_31827:107-2092(+)
MTTSAASSTMKTKAASSTLLEASWVSDGPKQKRVRSANNTIETQVYRALKDNFPTWGRDRTHGVLRNGKSLAERIESDKRRNASQPGSVSMGPAYYEALRTLHADSRDPSEQLKVKNTTVAVSADCLTAMVAAKSRPANRSLMVSWCKRTETINQTEIVGVLRWFVGLKGHKQDEQHLTELEVVKLMKRLSVDKSFPEEWSIVKEKSEDVMLKAFKKMVNSGQSTADFLKMHAPTWELFLDATQVATVQGMAKGSSWSSCADELLALVDGSRLGYSLFQCFTSSITAARVDACIKSFLNDLDGGGVALTVDSVAEHKRALHEKLQAFDLQSLKASRVVKLSYRGFLLEVETKSVAEHADLAIAAWLRGKAALSGGIPCLAAEADLMDGKSETELPVDATVMNCCRAARQWAIDIVNAKNLLTSASIQAELKLHYKKLIGMDAEWVIDHAFVQFIAGEGASKLLHARFLGLFEPIQTPSIASVLTGARSLQSSTLYRWSSQSCQATVDAAATMVAQLSEGVQPVMWDGCAPFLKEVWELIPQLCSCENKKVKKKDGVVVGESVELLRGKSAMESIWRRVSKTDDKDIAVHDLQTLTAFSWLLSPDVRSKVTTKLDQVSTAYKTPRPEEKKRKADADTACASQQKLAKQDTLSAQDIAKNLFA